MGSLTAGGLTITTDILGEPGSSVILKIVFAGTHDHRWPHGREIEAFIRAKAEGSRCTACLFDFLSYQCEFGMEINGPIIAACVDSVNKVLRDFAIVADELTVKHLKYRFALTMLDRIFRLGVFSSLDEASAFLRGLPVRNGKSRRP